MIAPDLAVWKTHRKAPGHRTCLVRPDASECLRGSQEYIMRGQGSLHEEGLLTEAGSS
jgi:hypothetical protein